MPSVAQGIDLLKRRCFLGVILRTVVPACWLTTGGGVLALLSESRIRS
jgi:hypothetical protein